MSRWDNLRPITGDGQLKEVKFLTVDIEASKWINFTCIGYYDGVKDNFKYFSNLKVFTKSIMNYCGENEIGSVFAHNGGKYDFNFLLQSFLFDHSVIVSDIIPRGSGLLCFTVQEREPTHLHNGEGFKVTFRDSLALLPFGLAKLAKAFKVKVLKGNIDYDFIDEIWNEKGYINKVKSDPERYKILDARKKTFTYFHTEQNVEHHLYSKQDLIDYLRDDLISLWQCLDTFFSWPLVQASGICFTTASQAVKIWQTFIKKPIHKLAGTSDLFIRKGYFGGRVEVFNCIFDSEYNIKLNKDGFSKEALNILKTQKGKTLNYYDVNSLYPYVMRDNDYPNRCRGWTYRYDTEVLGFWECTVKVRKDMHFPPLGVKHDIDGTEKLIFPTGTFKGIWTTYEIEYAKTLGIKIIKVHRGITFDNGGKMFKSFIKTLYDIRLEAKRKKDSVNDVLSKLIMNSCYGRLGLNVEREGLCLDTGESGLKIHSEITNPESGESVRIMSKHVTLDSAFTNVAISAYVTAYSRILMHTYYLKSGPLNTFYTDTDSIFTMKKFPVGEKLGQMKLEYTTKSAVFLLPKTYINEGVEGEDFTKKVTMKGFDRKKIVNFTVEDFRNQLRGEVDSLMVNQEAKFATLRTALSKGFFLCLNYDGDTNRKVDEKKLKNEISTLKALEKELKKREKEGTYFKNVLLEMKKFKSKIAGRKKKLKTHNYNESKRSVKAQYDKRVIVKEGFSSDPIHLGE